MAIIAVAHVERGSGKTTLAVLLAGEIRRRGLEVALVDADPEGSSSLWAEPGNLDFAVYENPATKDRIVAWVNDVRSIKVDCLLVDTASDELSIDAALNVADILVVPTNTSGNDIEAIAKLMGLVQKARSQRGTRLRAIIVPNGVDHAARAQQRQEVEVAELDAVVVPGLVWHNDIASAFASGRAICESAPGSDTDHQVRDLCDILQREAALAVHQN